MLLKPYGDSYEEYKTKVGELLESFPLGMRILGETAERAFIALVGAILTLRNILTTFDELAGDDILTDRQVQGSLSRYLDLYAEYRRTSDRAPSLPHVHMPRTHVT